MAKNGPRGSGRHGTIRNRSQVRNPLTDKWTKRNTQTGRFLDQQQDGTPSKIVRKEK